MMTEVVIRDDVPGIMVSKGNFLIGCGTAISTDRVRATLAHEIGTPLNVIAGRAKRLARNADDEKITANAAIIYEDLAVLSRFKHPQRQGEQVIAVVDADGCAPLAVPYSAVACLQPAGGATSCNQAHGSDPAVVAVPYRAATYTATGRGCAGWPGLPPAPDCQLLGPAVAAP